MLKRNKKVYAEPMESARTIPALGQRQRNSDAGSAKAGLPIPAMRRSSDHRR
jgi:hypothetical protein